jgi:predicted GIY-YIG superfamily endonuclease
MRDGTCYQFWVYILTSRTGTLYVGMTGYLGTRILLKTSICEWAKKPEAWVK